MSGFFQTVKENKKLFWAYVPLILLYASSYFQRIGIPGQMRRIEQYTESLRSDTSPL